MAVLLGLPGLLRLADLTTLLPLRTRLLLTLLAALTTLLPRQLLGELLHFLTQLLLFTLQTFQFPPTLLFVHGLETTGQIALGTRQPFLTPGKLFQLVLFLGGLPSATAAGTLRRLITVLELTHFHLEQFAQILALLLGAGPHRRHRPAGC